MFKRSLMTLAALSLVPLESAAALRCGPGLRHVNVNGSVTTINVTPSKQVGQICLALIESASGREALNDCGALIGRTVASDPETGTSTHSHTAVFDFRNAFVTQNDQAQVTGVLAVDDAGAPCAFSVYETITEIQKGIGIFRGGSLAVTATGSVSTCPNKNLNTFTLAGEACIRK